MRRREAEAIVASVGAARRGIVPAVAAFAIGVTAPDLARLRRAGVLIDVGRGVDRLRDHPFTWEARCEAALALAGPGATLGPRSTARLNGCYSYRDSDAVEVLTRRGRDHRTSLGRVIVTSWLPTDHVTRLDGFPTLTLGRMFFGLCADPDPGLHYRHPVHERNMARVYNDALARRGLTFSHLSAVLLVTAKRGRQGTTLVRSILVRFPPEHRPAESDTEFLFLVVLETYGVTEPVRQLAISDEQGFIGIVDNAWPDARLVVEIDSTWHDGPIDRSDDADRDRRLAAAGYRVERWRYPDLVQRPAEIARTVKRLLVERTPPRSGGN